MYRELTHVYEVSWNFHLKNVNLDSPLLYLLSLFQFYFISSLVFYTLGLVGVC